MSQGSKTNRQTKPRLNTGGAKSPTIAFRCRGDLYDRLKASAETRGYSLSEEIEHRLNRSLDRAPDDVVEHALQLISDNWRAIQNISRRKMLEDRFTLQACCEAAYRAVELFGTVNNISLNIGELEGLGPEGDNIQSAKQLGHAIVHHRELVATGNAPKWMTDVYEANIIDALTKRVAYLQTRVDEVPAKPEPELDTAQWAGRAFLVDEFRDAATSEILETVTGPEYDAADPAQRPSHGDGYKEAIARLMPIRHKVDIETFTAHVMKDGTVKRISLDLTPAGPGPQPQVKPTPAGTRWATPDEIAGMVDAPGQLPESISGQAIHDDAVAGLPLVKAEKAAIEEPAPAPAYKPKTVKRKLLL